jgi:hypothetical protein
MEKGMKTGVVGDVEIVRELVATLLTPEVRGVAAYSLITSISPGDGM